MKNFWRRLLPGGERLHMPPAAVTRWFWAIMALLSLPMMIIDSAHMYDSLIAQGANFWAAAGSAFGSFVITGVILLGLLGGMLFFIVSLFTSVVIPDTVSGYRSARDTIRRIPAAWQRFRDNCARAWSRLRQAAVAFFRFLGGLPVRIRAMTAEQWLFGLYAILSFGTLGGMLWLTWGWSGAVVGWLPHWMSDGKDWMLQLIVGIFICMIPWSITMTVLSSLVKALIRRRNGR